MSNDPIALLFGGMEKLGPGDDTETLQILKSLPEQTFQLVVDAGCGSGRQTLVLAKALNVPIHALDTYQLFLDELEQRAQQAGLEHLVRTCCKDMQAIPDIFRDIDLLWSEGAAYSIGFANALTSWFAAIRPSGFLVVSELTWLRARPPEPVKVFFQSEYPDMRSHQENLTIAEAAGYRVLGTRILPPETWVDGFYDVLEPRARTLLDHTDSSVREFAANMLTEIDIFNRSESSYSYAFYILQRP
ncbi:MAG: class I SAM-dependent methyltransferase [Cyanobacteria bacterium P01_D01_bin.123]